MGNNTQVQLLRSSALSDSGDGNTAIDIRLRLIKVIYLNLRLRVEDSFGARLLSKVLMGHMRLLAGRQDFTHEQAQAGALLFCEILSDATVRGLFSEITPDAKPSPGR
jgi:hypothetical protein